MWYDSKTCLKISACLGVASVLLSGITISFVDDIYAYIVNKYMVLSPQSARYEPWRRTLQPLTFRVYLFNWTNPQQVLQSGQQPHLVEVGPYTYSEYDEKVDVQWHNNHTVSYRLHKNWYFQPENSNGSLDDLITTADMISLTAASIAERENFMLRRFVSSSMAWHTSRAYSTHTVHELLFGGYSDNLLDSLKSVSFLSNSDAEMFPFDKFGFFYKANGSLTEEGDFNVATGAGNISRLGLVSTWNHSNRTRYFPGGCGHLRGSTGELWPPWITKSDKLSIFSKDLCRCLGLGVRDISPCKYRSPMFLSFPHFYDADPHFGGQVAGLRPDASRHKFSIVIQPDTGVSLEILGRTQFNMLLESKRYIGLFQKVPTVLLPVMWVEMEWRLDADKAAHLWTLLSVRRVMQLVCILVLVLGASAASISTLLMARRLRASRDKPADTSDRETNEKEKESLVCGDIPMVVNMAVCRK